MFILMMNVVFDFLIFIIKINWDTKDLEKDLEDDRIVIIAFVNAIFGQP